MNLGPLRIEDICAILACLGMAAFMVKQQF